jgi:hypothetical protein
VVESIEDRLTPKHLILEAPSDEELKEQVAKAALPEKPEVDPDKPDPRGEKRYTFQIEYKDARGKVWKGQFSNKILSIHERQQVGVMRSMLSGGQPLPSLDAMTMELNLMVAHMAYSLTEKPDWASNLRSLEDPGVLQAIYTEVDSHESYFLGWGAPQSSGEESA